MVFRHHQDHTLYVRRRFKYETMLAMSMISTAWEEDAGDIAMYTISALS